MLGTGASRTELASWTLVPPAGDGPLRVIVSIAESPCDTAGGETAIVLRKTGFTVKLPVFVTPAAVAVIVATT